MSALFWANHHRLWTGAIGIVVILVAAIAGAWFFVLRSPGSQLSQAQALELYKKAQKARGSATARLPEPGVYRYGTSGSENLSIAGISREFPASADIIVADGQCATMQWEPFLQHTEGLVECREADGALTIPTASSYEAIAGTTTNSVINCPATTYLIPPDPFVGEQWKSTCHSGRELVIVSGRVIAFTSIQLGGSKVPALHTHLTYSFSGAEMGTNPNDYWVAIQSGLILRQQESVDITQQAGPLGNVYYTEGMSIDLSSATPMR